MSGIAGIVHWDGRPVSNRDLRRMLDLIRHRGPDGLEGEVYGSIALGHAKLAMRVGKREQTQPVWLPDRSTAIVADARLFNRAEVLGSLGAVEWFLEEPSDASILLAAYERWGERLVGRLNGDFAFAIWDSRNRLLFAARDPFGAKPFFFWTDEKTLRFGSEPKQLLMFPEVPIEPEDSVVLGHLMGRPQAHHQTFFKGVVRLQAGHYLVASDDGVSHHAYWRPLQRGNLEPDSKEDDATSFRALFKEAIASRLETGGPVGTQLSGGLDSSSVAVVAADLYRNPQRALPELKILSESYPGLPCDETPFIETMLEKLPFESRWNDCSVLDLPTVIDEELWKEDGPTPELTPDRTRRNAAALSAFDSRLLMTGYGGDELTWDPEWAPDLLRDGRIFAAVSQAWHLSRRSGEDGIAPILSKAVVKAMPDTIRRKLVGLRPRRQEMLPAHVKANLISSLGQSEADDQRMEEGASLAQRAIYRWLTDPLLHWNLERLELRYAAWGKELRHPFFDRMLAELVLSIPFERRVAAPDRDKALLREAMKADLPPEILGRSSQVVFDAYFVEAWQHWRPAVRDVIHSSDDWLSQAYTERQKVLSRLELSAGKRQISMRELSQLWAAVNLELWLRGLSRYSAAEYDGVPPSLGDLDHA